VNTNDKICFEIEINAPLQKLWEVITIPAAMKRWMGELEMNIEIVTDWIVGNPILIKGYHHAKFENRGFVLQYRPAKSLQYNYISSLSRLTDRPENYTKVAFVLEPREGRTQLTVTLSNFPTETIMRHVHLYWSGTMAIIKKIAEEGS
jgi:uncharacterized protein YndB with AHSA1/START domain